ncbi:hypothetical protein DRO66_09425, partial [Candidatus Bathyarchaeota archaeon]
NESRLIVQDHALWDIRGTSVKVWASVSVKDSTGGWVTGLKLNDFRLSEALLSPTGEILEEHALTFDEPNYQFDGPGFWERSVTAEKLDIVFVIDMTGSMNDEMPAIRDELTKLTDRLLVNRVDFRIGFITYRPTIADHRIYGFYNVMYVNELYNFLNNHPSTSGGENWEPTPAYDFLMLATHSQMDRSVLEHLEYRNDARRVIVVITDTIPQSVYGNWWYIDSTAANSSAAEIAFEGSGFEVFYSQPKTKDELEHITGHFDKKINPRADCGFSTLGTGISWPFQQEDIPLGNYSDLSDSRYYFAWRSNILEPDNDPESHSVKVTIQTQDPDQPGNTLKQSFEYPPYLKETSLVINLTDESGNPPPNDDLWAFIYYEMDDRSEEVYYQLKPENGQIVIDDIPVGKYHLLVPCGGNHSYGYEYLRYRLSERIIVPSNGLTLDLQVETADREIELAKAYGLLKDLGEWGVSGKPFTDFTTDSKVWLNELDTQGIPWDKMEAIKRFYIALSGYNNVSGYAEIEAERIVDDFKDILLKFRDIVNRIRDIESETDKTYASALVEASARVDLLSIAEIVALEVTVDAIKAYVDNELVPDVIEKIIEQIPEGTYKNLLEILVNNLILGNWANWPELLTTITDLAIDYPMDEIQDAITAELLGDINISSGAGELVWDMLSEFMTGGFGNFQPFLESFDSTRFGPLIAQYGTKENLILAIDEVFNQINGQLGASPLRDFLLPMIRIIMRSAVQKGDIDDDVIIGVLAHHFTQQFILKPNFSDPVNGYLADALQKAKDFVPGSGDSRDRTISMHSDFADLRIDIMRDIQTDSWDALSEQPPIDDFTVILAYLFDMLEPVGGLFDGLCDTGYLMCCSTGDEIEELVGLLDAVELMTTVIEMSLKTMDLTNFQQGVQPINDTVLVE